MFSLFPALLLLTPPAPSDGDLPAQLQHFVDVYSVVEREAADPIAPDKAIFQGAIPAMLRRLDPHSVFLDPDQFQQLKDMETSTRKGFGSIVSVLPGRVSCFRCSPALPRRSPASAPAMRF